MSNIAFAYELTASIDAAHWLMLHLPAVLWTATMGGVQLD